MAPMEMRYSTRGLSVPDIVTQAWPIRPWVSYPLSALAASKP